MERINSILKGKRQKKVKNVFLIEIINMKEIRNILKEIKKIKLK